MFYAIATSGAGRPASITDVSDALPSLAEIVEVMTFRAGYNTNCVLAGAALLGLAAGLVGAFALLRGRSLMSDALSHATLPGIALAFIGATALGLDGRSLPVLLAGGTVTGVIGVLCIHWLLRRTRLHADAAIGIVLSVFFGAGVVGLSYIQNDPGGNAAGLNHFIYGQTAAMRAGDAMLMGGIALVAVIATLLLHKEFALTCFNDAFARVDGWPVGLIDLLMMALAVAVTVAGLQAVGLILVVSLLIIPPVAARFWTDRLWLLLALSGVIGATSGYFGSVMSALLPRKPAGSVIVLTAGVVFAVSMLAAPRRGVVSIGLRRMRQRLRFAVDHVLEAMHDRRVSGASDGGVGLAEFRAMTSRRGWSSAFRVAAVSALRRGGLARVAGGRIAPTEAGLERGARVRRNHRLWEQYLISYADVAPSHVDWSVDQVEHVLSDELVAELERALSARGVIVPGAIGGGGSGGGAS